MFEGERYDYTSTLVKAVMAAAPLASRPFLQYDIACKFIPYFQRQDPQWFRRLHGYALNAFHSYAHELPCQLKFGPLGAKGIGRSDGEGCERDWSSKACLVASLRTTTSETRTLVLDIQSIYHGQLLRQRLGSTFTRRWNAAHSQIQLSLKGFQELHEQGYATTQETLHKFLHEQHTAKKAYFKDN